MRRIREGRKEVSSPLMTGRLMMLRMNGTCSSLLTCSGQHAELDRMPAWCRPGCHKQQQQACYKFCKNANSAAGWSPSSTLLQQVHLIIDRFGI